MLTIDQHRTSETQGHLYDTGTVFDVARQHGRIEGVAADMVQRGAGALPQEAAAPGRRLAGVAVAAITRCFFPGPPCRRRPRSLLLLPPGHRRHLPLPG